jgi:hypothetical protein
MNSRCNIGATRRGQAGQDEPAEVIAAGDDDLAKTRARDRAGGRNGAAAPAAATNKAASGESGEGRKSEEHNGPPQERL